MKQTSTRANDTRRSTTDDSQHGAGNEASARGHPIETLHRHAGNQAVQALFERGELQAKLAVSDPSDPAEREAERVADEVMRMEESSEGGTDATAVPDVQRSASGDVGGEPLSGDVEAQVRSSLGGGKPLPESTRSTFESRFGQDFSDVRVHTGPGADEAARSIDASAFTVGTDVAFAKGNYDPGSRSGKKLLAHELTHVVQQTGTGRSRGRVQRQDDDSQDDQQSGGARVELREALEGGFLGFGGPEDDEILKLLRNASEEERAAILGDDSLMADLESSLSREKMLEALRILGAGASTQLRTAMDGWGAGDDTLLSILRDASEEERAAILGDDTLMADLESSLSREKMLEALRILGADASLQLRTAMDGWGADRGAILAIVRNAPEEEREAILDDDALMADLHDSLSRGEMLEALEELGADLVTKIETALDGWGTPTEEIVDLIGDASGDELKALAGEGALLAELTDELPREISYEVLDMIWDQAAGLNFAEKERLFELRFSTELGAQTASARRMMGSKGATRSGDYKPSESDLEDLYDALSKIPPNALASMDFNNIMACRIPATPQGTITQGAARADTGNLYINEVSWDEQTAVHEAAHIYDKNDEYSGDDEFRAISDWNTYDDMDDLVSSIKSDTNPSHPNSLDKDEKKIVDRAAEIAAGRKDRESVGDMEPDVIAAYQELGSGKADELEQEAKDLHKNELVGADALLETIAHGHDDNNPYFNPGGFPSALQNNLYHLSYGSTWMSLTQDAHPGIGGSGWMPEEYSSRGPGEEFADVFAAWTLANDPASEIPEVEGAYGDWYRANVIKDSSLFWLF